MTDQRSAPQPAPQDLVAAPAMCSPVQAEKPSETAICTPLPLSRPNSVISALSVAPESAQERRPELVIPLPESRSSSIDYSESAAPHRTPNPDESANSAPI